MSTPRLFSWIDRSYNKSNNVQTMVNQVMGRWGNRPVRVDMELIDASGGVLFHHINEPTQLR